MYQDRVLTCRDCNGQFTFTSGEQEFYAERSFSDPLRCPTCRAARKSARGGNDNAPLSFSSPDRGGYAETSRGWEREMFTATCATCGGEARVPFRPSAGRPVYCSNCYSPERREPRASYGSPRY